MQRQESTVIGIYCLIYSAPQFQIVATSRASCALINNSFPGRKLLGSCILPEIPLRGNHISPSLRDQSCAFHVHGDRGQVGPVLFSPETRHNFRFLPICLLRVCWLLLRYPPCRCCWSHVSMMSPPRGPWPWLRRSLSKPALSM